MRCSFFALDVLAKDVKGKVCLYKTAATSIGLEIKCPVSGAKKVNALWK